MSDSDDQSQTVPDARIASELRNEVTRCFQDNDLDNLTVKRVRAVAAKNLGLTETFFKDNVRWSARSKEVIGEEVSRHEDNNNHEGRGAASPGGSAGQPDKKLPAQKRKDPQNVKSPNKRQKKSPRSARVHPGRDDPSTALARGKASSGELSTESSRRTSDHSIVKPPQPSLPKNIRGDDSSSDLSEVEDVDSPARSMQTEQESSKRPEIKHDDGDSSELSEVLDPEPPPKKSRKKRESSDAPAKSSKSTKSTSNAKVKPDLSPQDEEIRRLQSQLVKCGIRKVWGKELKPFETPKAKISHLKSMLENAGMKGRFSEEKARQIKEARELKADIEAIEEGNKMWGTAQEEGEERPRRVQVAKGLEELDQFVDQESESD